MLNSLETAGPAAEPTDAAKQMTETAQKLIRMAGTNRAFDAWKLLMWLEAILWSLVLALSLCSLLVSLRLPELDHTLTLSFTCNSVMGIADFSGFILHWWFARQKRWVHRDIIRVPDLPPIRIRILEVLGAFGLGLPYPVYILFVLVIMNTDDPGAPEYACLLVPTLLMLLLSMLPHIATTLLVQQDLEHLGAEVKRVCDLGRQEDFMQLLETVSSVKKRWANFLRLHFLCEGAGTAAFILRELTLVSHFAQDGSPFPMSFAEYARQAFVETPCHIGGGMFAAFLLWQVVSIARFNRHIDVCKEQVRSNTIHRMLLQHERKLQIGVMGVAITHTKIRAILTSVVLSMCGKFFVKLIN